ncbi:hypothetical protein [Herpetosiphon geysericola]|uniref:Uncharacterized protein n=1 Tax=Herpetosiphon geysericola TaxID=70996 RepID=A0A0P6XZI8_9CHLR|nr:hypothetical protein [Herpetosiphon geysericola]KPL90349.1 hypothetical protein SE18_06970 [Herpetosiphon geysericola]
MRRSWLFGLAGIFSALWLMVACGVPDQHSNRADQTTPTSAQTSPLTIVITTSANLQAASLTNPLVLTQTEPLVWLALAKKDPAISALLPAEVGVEEGIYPAQLLSINGLGQQTTITIETYGLIDREQGLPLPIYVPNPLHDKPFSARVFTDHAEISWQIDAQFSPKLDYVAVRSLKVGESTSSDTTRLELTNLQTGVTSYIGEVATDFRVQHYFIGWSDSGIYEISGRHSSSIHRFDPSSPESNTKEGYWNVGGEGGFDDYFIDIQHGLLAFAKAGEKSMVGIKHLQTNTDLVVEPANDTVKIDHLSISPDGRYLAYLYHPTRTEDIDPTPGNIRLYSIEQQRALGELAIEVNPDTVREKLTHYISAVDGTMLLWSTDSQYLLALTCDPQTPWKWNQSRATATCDEASPIKQQRHALVFRIADQQQLADIVLPARTGSIKLIRPNLLAMIAYVKGEALLIFCDLTTGQQTLPLALGKVVPLIVYPR